MIEVPLEDLGQVIAQFQDRPLYEIKLTGTGGQGIILMGYILGNAAMLANYNATQVQSYSAATRGGDVSSDVIIRKEGGVNFPVVKKMDLLLAFTQSTFNFYKGLVKPGGIILADEDLVADHAAKVPVLSIPATRLAQDTLGRKVTANLVMLGALSHVLPFISASAFDEAIHEALPPKSYQLNVDAFHLGLSTAAESFPPTD
jgi:2-oxoglutarate ferredoxin oxidoreductase subunit gamma